MEVLHFMIPPRLYHQLIIKSLTYTIFSKKKKRKFFALSQDYFWYFKYVAEYTTFFLKAAQDLSEYSDCLIVN